MAVSFSEQEPWTRFLGSAIHPTLRKDEKGKRLPPQDWREHPGQRVVSEEARTADDVVLPPERDDVDRCDGSSHHDRVSQHVFFFSYSVLECH